MAEAFYPPLPLPLPWRSLKSIRAFSFAICFALPLLFFLSLWRSGSFVLLVTCSMRLIYSFLFSTLRSKASTLLVLLLHLIFEWFLVS